MYNIITGKTFHDLTSYILIHIFTVKVIKFTDKFLEQKTDRKQLASGGTHTFSK